jgi:predicted nucleotidyltransferase
MTKKSIHSSSVAGSLITSQARLAVLKLLLLNAGQRFYLREVAARTRLPVRAVQLELARLETSGLLESSAEGGRKYYQANRGAPVFPELKSLLLKTVGLGDLLQDYLRQASGRITLAFIFGSYARGTDVATSDIDLIVVGSIAGRALAKLLAPARESLGREVNTVIMTEAEFRRKASHGDHFLTTILGESKIYLIGGHDELEKLAGAGSSAPAPDDQ